MNNKPWQWCCVDASLEFAPRCSLPISSIGPHVCQALSPGGPDLSRWGGVAGASVGLHNRDPLVSLSLAMWLPSRSDPWNPRLKPPPAASRLQLTIDFSPKYRRRRKIQETQTKAFNTFFCAGWLQSWGCKLCAVHPFPRIRITIRITEGTDMQKLWRKKLPIATLKRSRASWWAECTSISHLFTAGCLTTVLPTLQDL